MMEVAFVKATEELKTLTTKEQAAAWRNTFTRVLSDKLLDGEEPQEESKQAQEHPLIEKVRDFLK